MVKTYILDTNILLQTEGRVVFGLDDNNVVIPGIVLEELDNMKSSPGERGFAARESIRNIAAYDNNKEKGNLSVDVRPDTGNIPEGWDHKKPDNIILATAQNIIKNNTNGPVILISNDIAMQIKAKMLDIPVQDYKNDQIQETEEYTGRDVVENLDDDFINLVYKKECIDKKKCKVDLPSNKYMITKSISNQSALIKTTDAEISLIRKEQYGNIFGISPKNSGQTFAMHALMAPVDEAPLVILKGCAGTGKTILSLAAAMFQMEREMYDKIIITRSNTLSDEELGFLPGDLEAKMGPLLAPFYDNLRFLFKIIGESDEQTTFMIDSMLERGSLEIVSLAYIRGRSIPNTFIIVDEAQNLSVTQAKTIITRAGIGTKIVLLGDPGQIDNPRLDKRNNGLTYLSEKFKNEPLCYQVAFTQGESVRSPLASKALEILEN